jgi:hypothetical protein
MPEQTPARPEKRSRWIPRLYLMFILLLLLTGIGQLPYRFSLPTDGWEVSEASNLPGLAYIKNIMAVPSALQPGDHVIALEGIPADWQTVRGSSTLEPSWQAGATLEYTVLRDGQEIHIPVTLVRWQTAKWLPAILRDPGKMAGLISTVSLLALAGFVYTRQPGNAAAGAFLLIMALFTSSTLSDTIPMGFSVWLDPLAAAIQGLIFGLFLGGLFPFALIRFALTFPHPKPIQQRHPWLAFAVGAVGLGLFLLLPNSPATWFWFVLSIVLTLVILVHNAVTMRDAVSRAQMLWGLGGFIIGFGILALMFLAGTLGLFPEDPALFERIASLTVALAMTVMGSMVAMAILRYRLFDIEVIIRRTLVYGLLTALLALVYFGSVVLFQLAFSALTGERSPLAIVLSTLLIAALFSPLRGRLQALIDRRFFRRKYDATQALGRFAAAARDEVDLDQLTAALLQVVDDTVQPAKVGLWLARKRDRPDQDARAG